MMLGLELKLIPLPIAAAFAGVDGEAIIAITVALVAGAFTIRSQAYKLVKEDRDEQKRARERAEAKVAELTVRVTELAAKPDYNEVVQLLRASREHDLRMAALIEKIQSADRP